MAGINIDFLNTEHSRVLAAGPSAPVYDTDPILLAAISVLKASGLTSAGIEAVDGSAVPATVLRREGWAKFFEVLASAMRDSSGHPVEGHFLRDGLRTLAISHVEALSLAGSADQIGGA